MHSVMHEKNFRFQNSFKQVNQERPVWHFHLMFNLPIKKNYQISVINVRERQSVIPEAL